MLRARSPLPLLVLLAASLGGPAAAEEEPIEAELTEVAGDSVKLDEGRAGGVEVGQVFDLYRDRQVYFLPLSSGEAPLVRAQEKVGRVLVYHTEAESARALIVSRDEGPEGEVPAIEPGLRALLDPKAEAPNRPPRFTSTPSPEPIPWGSSQRLFFRVSNDLGDQIVYTWSSTGGRLARARSQAPVNTWTAPPRAGDYQVSVAARDQAGNVARMAVTVTSEGVPEGFEYGELRPRDTFGASSRYREVLDVAHDSRGRRYVLERTPGGIFTSGSLSILVEFSERPPVRLDVPSGREFTSLVVSDPKQGTPGAIFALDTESRAVFRYGFGGAWGKVLEQEPVVIGELDGGTGNGRFLRPTDIALSPRGELYVLDAGQRAIQVFSNAGEFLVSFGRPGRESLRLQRPVALAVGPDGGVYVLDDDRKAVIVYRDFRPREEFGVGGPDAVLAGLAVDPFSSHVYVLDRTSGWVKRYEDGELAPPHFTPDAGTLEQLTAARRLRLDPTRVLWVLDREGRSVVRLDAVEMDFLGRTGGVELSGALRIAGTPDGGVVALDRGDYRVTCFDPQGWIRARFGGAGTRPGSFEDPVDVAVGPSGDVFVLDAEKQQVLAFSRRGRFLKPYGQPGRGARELTGAVDLSVTDDRNYLVVLQQRQGHNFNLIHHATGRSDGDFGRGYGSELTPRFGCVTGIKGELGGGDRGSSPFPSFWTVDDYRELVYRKKLGQDPTQLEPAFDDVSDLEPSVTGWLVVCDWGEAQVSLIDPRGRVAQVVTSDSSLAAPWDVGLDDYGSVFVYDHSTRRIVELAD